MLNLFERLDTTTFSQDPIMSLQHTVHRVSTEDYLQNELQSKTKHQLIDGEIYAMAGASENHNLLALNIASELKSQLKGTRCRTFMADMKVKVADDFFYPDVMVVCSEDNENDYYKTAPVIIVEVLSKSTRRFDQTAKKTIGNHFIITWVISSPSIHWASVCQSKPFMTKSTMRTC